MNKAPELRFLFGLGNPGDRYRFTRHNVGTRFLQFLLEGPFSLIEKKREHRIYTSFYGYLFEKPLFLVWPHTYMNDSGRGFALFCQKQTFQPDQGLLIYDDLDIPFGSARLRPRGSAGGHRGLISIFTWAETDNIPRLRIGVGRENLSTDVTSYLLSNFSREDEDVILKVFQCCEQALETLFTYDMNRAMNYLNRTSVCEPCADS